MVTIGLLGRGCSTGARGVVVDVVVVIKSKSLHMSSSLKLEAATDGDGGFFD